MDKFSVKNDRRRYFRIDLDTPLCTEMTIVEINSKKIKSGITNVCVSNIGAGGLSFTSPLDFPMGKEILFRFNTTIFKESIYFIGNIIRNKKIKDDLYKYGVHFILDDQIETKYIRILNRLSIALKKNPKNVEYSTCTRNKCRYADT
ncbi:PilZ domain-containing protein [Clostridium kluyveri]|uniref:PilZ domain-containing protein n=1 Tax=Clostridium kluyveri TaxID=1534 RepID=A0A1L5F481_CLOKL|nr:PilZ domain-containing protein [Clostridium kluyveri]APM37816.1 hypothetical protein BS101_03215 [Clostridium kluyveri]